MLKSHSVNCSSTQLYPFKLIALLRDDCATDKGCLSFFLHMCKSEKLEVDHFKWREIQFSIDHAFAIQI